MRTRPVTGLSFARDEAYDTDCGIRIDAMVIPAKRSPPSLPECKNSTVAGEYPSYVKLTGKTNTLVSIGELVYSISLSAIWTGVV